LRIIAGRFRGRKLKSPPSRQTRPTSDRLRETLFDILAPGIEGARFLDLCAGTGAVGIEALSRGAVHVTFVDQSRKMCGLIESNLAALNDDADSHEIVVSEALDYVRRLVQKGSPAFEFVFFDPPYAALYEALLGAVGEHASQMLAADGILIVEHYKKNSLPPEFNQLTRYRELKQGDSILSFYRAA
jgi:16S rRNA (guanine966-N2)-methyltransferase